MGQPLDRHGGHRVGWNIVASLATFPSSSSRSWLGDRYRDGFGTERDARRSLSASCPRSLIPIHGRASSSHRPAHLATLVGQTDLAGISGKRAVIQVPNRAERIASWVVSAWTRWTRRTKVRPARQSHDCHQDEMDLQPYDRLSFRQPTRHCPSRRCCG